MPNNKAYLNEQYEKRCRSASFFETEAEVHEVRIALHRAFNLYKLDVDTAGELLETLEDVIIRVKAGLGYYYGYDTAASEESVRVNISSAGGGETLMGFQEEANNALGNLELLKDCVLEVPGALLPEEIDLTLFDELEKQLCLAFLRYQVARTSVRKSEHGKKGAAVRKSEVQVLHNRVIEMARELLDSGHHERSIVGIIEKRGVGIKARQIRNILKEAGFKRQ